MENLNIALIKDDKELLKKAEMFLNNIETIPELDIELLDNGACVLINNDIVGYITFEDYSEYGLIRYFIFQKRLDVEIIFQMFNKLTDVAKENGILSFIAIGKTEEVVVLFERLGFYKIDSSNLIINSRTVEGTNLEDASILKYDI